MLLPLQIQMNLRASVGYTLTASTGTYALNGQAALFARTYVLAAQQGQYALNGQNAELIAPVHRPPPVPMRIRRNPKPDDGIVGWQEAETRRRRRQLGLGD